MTAIVTDVHYRMSLALVRTLGEAGVEVITCERDGCRGSPAAPPLGALSRRAARHVWLSEEGYLDALLELCRERKYDGLELQVNARNAAARAMYEKYGFTEKSVNMEFSGL